MKMKLMGSTLMLFVLALTSCGTKNYAASDYLLKMNWEDDFTILQLSDIHLANKDDQDKHLAFLNKVIDKAQNAHKVNLIVATGDLFTFADKATAYRLFDFFESKQIPWTVTFGNHDEQCYFSIDWLTGYLNTLTTQGNRYCYFKDIQDDDVYGNANFAINLMEGDKIHSQVMLLDSNRYNFGEYIGYDYIKPNQIQWYERVTDYCKEQNGGEYVPSYLFFHIPIPEFADIWQKHLDGDAECHLLTPNAENNESTSSPKVNTHFYDALTTHGTKGVFVGHDHVNDWAIEYKGIVFSYCVTSTDRIYAKDYMMGCQTITLHNDNTLTINQYFDTYGEGK